MSGRLTQGLAPFLRGSKVAENRNTCSLWSAVTSDKPTCQAAVWKGVWFLAETPVALSAPHGSRLEGQSATSRCGLSSPASRQSVTT